MNTYNKHLKHNARKLRNESTPGEAILWKYVLRGKGFYGLQFNRQFIIENYIVDFVCRELKLIIELDGKYHDQIIDQDRVRDKRLKELGYQVIRIPEKFVIEDVNSVYHYLKEFIPEEIKERQGNNQSPNLCRCSRSLWGK
ncbi:MAG: DUF559 domain-containing protein [Roseivirga sp.]|uniref:endonuclease domain-containing protein n=1 Tax=Roseivirga sp. TaxID=1964215 RepID=UPI001B08BC07|nr:DUF559 domain-containing protein [Roseivirga sp.]MBO6497751.1 DUF559 domain-containing protein [Roseivirga sp.]